MPNTLTQQKVKCTKGSNRESKIVQLIVLFLLQAERQEVGQEPEEQTGYKAE
jgi:hypothetical protein